MSNEMKSNTMVADRLGGWTSRGLSRVLCRTTGGGLVTVSTSIIATGDGDSVKSRRCTVSQETGNPYGLDESQPASSSTIAAMIENARRDNEKWARELAGV